MKEKQKIKKLKEKYREEDKSLGKTINEVGLMMENIENKTNLFSLEDVNPRSLHVKNQTISLNH